VRLIGAGRLELEGARGTDVFPAGGEVLGLGFLSCDGVVE